MNRAQPVDRIEDTLSHLPQQHREDLERQKRNFAVDLVDTLENEKAVFSSYVKFNRKLNHAVI
jgi:hypothetical protein